MKRKLVMMFTMLFLMVMATPVLASVNLNINGNPFTPTAAPQLEEGITSVPVYVIARTLGADVTVDNNQIVINENGNILKMTIGNCNATYNGQNKLMPKAAEIVNGEVMVPVRFITEIFDASIDWQSKDQTVAVKYQEKRDGLLADEMLTKASKAMEKYNTYKMKVNMDMSNQIEAEGQESQTMDMTNRMEMAYQQQPLLMYIKQEISGLAGQDEEKIENITSESLINKDGFYMTMPDQGWVKMEIPGMDIATLMEQSGNQNVVDYIQQMKDAGVVMSYANDQVKDGKEYWVINVTMGPKTFQNFYQNMIKQIPALNADTTDTETSADFQNVMKDVLNNLQADMVYNLWIDKETLLTKFMDLDAKINMSMKAPDENQKITKVDMKMKEKAAYEIYDLGGSFTVPDVSGAMSMTEFMQKEQQK
ncbi:MAG: copper amine oxidase N-terminal domain-containing protein [Syntrophomonas sp.]